MNIDVGVKTKRKYHNNCECRECKNLISVDSYSISKAWPHSNELRAEDIQITNDVSYVCRANGTDFEYRIGCVK